MAKPKIIDDDKEYLKVLFELGQLDPEENYEMYVRMREMLDYEEQSFSPKKEVEDFIFLHLYEDYRTTIKSLNYFLNQETIYIKNHKDKTIELIDLSFYNKVEIFLTITKDLELLDSNEIRNTFKSSENKTYINKI